jgi:hypothetical protein
VVKMHEIGNKQIYRLRIISRGGTGKAAHHYSAISGNGGARLGALLGSDMSTNILPPDFVWQDVRVMLS